MEDELFNGSGFLGFLEQLVMCTVGCLLALRLVRDNDVTDGCRDGNTEHTGNHNYFNQGATKDACRSMFHKSEKSCTWIGSNREKYGCRRLSDNFPSRETQA